LVLELGPVAESSDSSQPAASGPGKCSAEQEVDVDVDGGAGESPAH